MNYIWFVNKIILLLIHELFIIRFSYKTLFHGPVEYTGP